MVPCWSEFRVAVTLFTQWAVVRKSDLRSLTLNAVYFYLSCSGAEQSGGADASGFHEKAGRCQGNFSIVRRGDGTRGACPSFGGSRRCTAAWGEPTRPRVPLGGNGKGGIHVFLPR